MEPILYFLLSLLLLMYGANLLVVATENFSIKHNISGFFASFLFIGIATSSPEIFISIFSGLSNESEIAVGNAIGSNIANIALVFAIALIMTSGNFLLNITRDKSLNRYLLILVLLSIFVVFATYNGKFNQIESLFFLTLFIGIVYILKNSKKNIRSTDEDFNKKRKIEYIYFWMILGLILLLVGTELFLYSSIIIAKFIGISEYVIGLSLAAIGTSLPELAASIQSIRKNHFDYVVGNILGSNIFNASLVIGLSSIIHPAVIESDSIYMDLILLCITTFVFYAIITTNIIKYSKIIGLGLLALFSVYQISLYGA